MVIGLLAIGATATIIALCLKALGMPESDKVIIVGPIAALAALFVSLIMLLVTSRTVNSSSGLDWITQYKAVKKAIAEGTKFASVSKDPQVFRMKTELKAGRDTGVQGVIKITAKDGTPFMTSIYGDGRPSATDTISAAVTLNDTADIQEWKNVPNFDEIELPYAKITLFPNIYKEWSFLLPCSGPTEELEKTFDTVCGMILHYAVLKKLQKGISGEDVDTEVVNRPYEINESIRSCFTKPENSDEPEEESNELQLLRKSIEQIETQVPMAHDQKTDELLGLTRQLLAKQRRTDTKNAGGNHVERVNYPPLIR